MSEVPHTSPDVDDLDPETVQALESVPACSHCGGRHARACPRVRSLRFHPNGTLAQVDFWRDGRWSDENVLWPDDNE